MEIIIVGAFLVVVIVVLLAVRSQVEPRDRRSGEVAARRLQQRRLTSTDPPGQRILNENITWLRERWDAAYSEESDGSSIFPEWFYDEVTDRQLRRINEMGLTISGGKPSKGQASDIIGLFEPVDDTDAEKLRFFNIGRTGMNQSRARHEVARLFADPANVESWENRPATPWQREFFRFMGWKVPKGLSHKEAQAREAEAEKDDLFDEWVAFSNLWDELCDQDMREDL